MSWTKLIYFPQPIKTHFVHKDIADIVIKDIENNYNALPSDRVDVLYLPVDPGGMICLNNHPKKKIIDNLQVRVQPEHILKASIKWSKNRVLETTTNNQKIYKIYLSDYTVAVVKEDIYFKVGSWLAKMKADGLVARAELLESLVDAPGIMLNDYKADEHTN